MGDADNYRAVRVMTQMSPKTREEVREDFPGPTGYRTMCQAKK